MEADIVTPARRPPLLLAISILLALLLLAGWIAGSARGAPTAGAERGVHDLYLPLIGQRTLVQLSLLTDEISAPIAITQFDGGRFLVTTNRGLVRVVSGTNVLPEPFLDLRAEVVNDLESAVYDIVLDPDFATNRYVYVSYLRNLETSIVARYTVSATNPNVADPTSRAEVLALDQPGPAHNGGGLAFGPDGYLYISFGDGLCCNDPLNNSQDLSVLLGKILRIDVTTLPYTVPADNPYVGTAGARDEIWASGLRNPWRMSFDPLTGDLYISDVGEQAWEEVNYQPAGAPGGANYGWRCYEGPAPFDTTGCDPVDAYQFPILTYAHDVGCAVTGGLVYRGDADPALSGAYLYADFCSGAFWLATRQEDGSWMAQEAGPFPFNPTGFGRDADGELLVVGPPNYVYRIELQALP